MLGRGAARRAPTRRRRIHFGSDSKWSSLLKKRVLMGEPESKSHVLSLRPLHGEGNRGPRPWGASMGPRLPHLGAGTHPRIRET